MYEASAGRDIVFLQQFLKANNIESNNQIATLHSFVQHVHRFSRKRIDKLNPPRVTIVGAGPVGLLSALESYMAGAHIVVLESRINYTRNVWFDFYPQPYSTAYDMLVQLGAKLLQVEYESQRLEQDEVITIRCQLLERFLSQVLVMLKDVTLKYDTQVVHYCPGYVISMPTNKAALHKSFDCNGTKFEHATIHSYDLLIAADGTQSLIRKLSKVNAVQVTELQTIHKQKRIQVPHLHQVAWIINFEPQNGSCPKIKIDKDTGRPIDPWYPGFVIPGITSVFKRFYHGHCHLQVVLDQELGDSLFKQYQHAATMKYVKQQSFADAADTLYSYPIHSTGAEELEWEQFAYPWDMLLSLCNLLFHQPFANVQQLKQHLVKRKTNDRYFDMVFLNVSLYQADPYVVAHDQSVLFFVGDALLTSHFRLGIGVNSAFLSYGEWIQFLQALEHDDFAQQTTKYKQALQNKIDATKSRLGKMIQYQATTMFYEAYCNNTYLVFAGNPYQDRYGQELFTRDMVQRQYLPILSDNESVDDIELLQACHGYIIPI